MSNRLERILQAWHSQKDNCEWVLATIIETKGSAYRKAGAMMLMNDLGQSYGLLSGGCLESDLMRKAKQCLTLNENIQVCYDLQEDSDVAWQLGIGCGGMVHVLLQPVSKENHYLQLDQLYQDLQNRQSAFYLQSLTSDQNQLLTSLGSDLVSGLSEEYFISSVNPAPSLLVFGGGIDAIPLVRISSELGWNTTVVDRRMGYASEKD
ncbi:MAG: xanthine dehydrogenase, partial [Gammaproteobacteria bacterium]|nr:xanthine dehydrogenase [Gammaproteobacteria bacterium]